MLFRIIKSSKKKLTKSEMATYGNFQLKGTRKMFYVVGYKKYFKVVNVL